MVLKFKIWKITYVKKGGKQYLVLRDKKGRIRRWARDDAEKRQLRRWYRKYQFGENLEFQLADMELKAKILQAKEAARKMGFHYQISLYGITKNGNEEKCYRRYEVFKEQPWTRSEVTELYNYFYTHIPKAQAGVFLWKNGRVMPICLLQVNKKKA
ncbi:MAG: hypothetical protein QXK24_02135 [Ignisphaera sp.]